MLIYFLIVLLATTVGSLTGMGGGVIIKPALDMLGQYDAATIGVLSSLTVLTMSCVSIAKQIRQKARIDFRIALSLAAGSIAGGWIGDAVLGRVIASVDNRAVVMLQNILLGLLLLGVFLYMQRKDVLPSLHARRTAAGLLTGMFAGMVSTFLGIGGGPINVAVLFFVFSMDAKTAAVNSIITIFFSQISKLSAVIVSGGFGGYDLSALPAMLVAAVIGGWLGAKLNRQLSEKQVELAFNLVQLAVFLLCLRNIFTNL